MRLTAKTAASTTPRRKFEARNPKSECPPRMKHGSNTEVNPCLIRVPSVAGILAGRKAVAVHHGTFVPDVPENLAPAAHGEYLVGAGVAARPNFPYIGLPRLGARC